MRLAGIYIAFSLPVVVLPAGAADDSPTFARDVLPIIQKRCQNCHVSGEVAPMTFVTYADVRPWAKAIREAVLRRTMPPWHADPTASQRFANDRSLPDEERKTLVAWVDGGAPEGTPVPYPTPSPRQNGWKLGPPDWKIRIPEFSIPAKGTVEYTYIILPMGLTEDKWVRAAEYNVEQRSLVHHINAFVRIPGSPFFRNYEPNRYFVPTGDERLVSERRGTFRRQFILGYEPGYNPRPWGDGRAKLVPAGSDLVLELHYTANGRAALDHTEFGLYFAPEPPRQRVYTTGAVNQSIEIPAGVSDYRSDAELVFAKDAVLLSMQPHMHLRGKAMEFRLVRPDGSTEPLLAVPRYDFNWQTTYFLEKPVPVAAGSRIECAAHFDNSTNNPANPDPAKTVRWGDQSWEEMHIGFMDIAFDASIDPTTVFQAPKKELKLP
jgi:hypothetical protein